jgi:(p)ppGpp synthase/HD superfamily hydrolase
MYSIELLQTAWQFAARAHASQMYGGSRPNEKIPYMVHIGSVLNETLWAAQQTPEINFNLALQCAILHDTLEDTLTTYNQLVPIFGEQVAQGVLALTKNEHLPTKNEQMLDSLWRIKTQPPEIGLVKMADRTANLQEPPFYWNKEKINRYRAEGSLIYEALQHTHAIMAARLHEKIAAYHQFC